MRLFLAIAIPEELKKEIKRYQKTIAHLPLRLLPPENLHVTLVFLGETPQSEIPQIEQKIQSILDSFQAKSYQLEAKSFEIGPDPRRPRLVWLTLKASQGLLELQRHLAHTLEKEEKREFTAHVTVARFNRIIKSPINLSRQFSASFCVCFAITELHLMESKLERSGAKYTTIKIFPLGDR